MNLKWVFSVRARREIFCFLRLLLWVNSMKYKIAWVNFPFNQHFDSLAFIHSISCLFSLPIYEISSKYNKDCDIMIIIHNHLNNGMDGRRIYLDKTEMNRKASENFLNSILTWGKWNVKHHALLICNISYINPEHTCYKSMDVA